MDDRVYKIFDSVRFPLAIGVIFIHSFGKPVNISVSFQNWRID